MHEKTWHSVASTKVSAPSHTWNIFNVDRFRRVVECFEAKLKKINKVTPFNAIAGCGNSGVPLVAALSYLMGIPMITVRKPGEETAAYMASRVTGAFNAGAYVIIDDFWSSGGTVNRMMDAIDEASGGVSRPVAMAFYDYRDNCEGTKTKEWWSKDILVPVWGISNAEFEFIDLGTKMRVNDAQEDLFDWARKRLRERRRLKTPA
jgi:adenine/guanine phosphoribosyltransferase-like PRPP-binding protein